MQLHLNNYFMRFLLISSLLALAAVVEAQVTPYKVLFIGNSYTGSYNLPMQVSELARSAGDSIIYDSHTPGGARFLNHASNGTALNKIASNDWDFVVLQGQSQEPSWSDGQMATDVYPYAKVLADSIKANNPCSEPLFYMTWGRRYGDAMNCMNWPPVCTFEGMTSRLRHGYTTMANANDATIAPAGPAWRNSIAADSNLVLHSIDNSHPAPEGVYLTACVFYASIFRKSPVGLTYDMGLDPADVAFLQQIAHTTVLDSMENWRIGHGDVEADFGIDTSGLTANFSDSSVNATSYTWNIEGATYNVANPSHTFDSSGTYIVTLQVSNGCTTANRQRTVTVSGTNQSNPPDPSAIAEAASTRPELKIFPNPASTRLYLHSPESEVSIFNLLGSPVESLAKGINSLSLEHWPRGIYLVKSGALTKRLVVR